MIEIFRKNFDVSRETLENILGSEDRDAAQSWGKEYKQFVTDIETRMSKEAGWTKTNSAFLSIGARERQRTIASLEAVQAYLATKPRGAVVDVLDADCGYGHGTDLLASMYLNAELGYRLRVAAVCHDPKRLGYIQSQFRTFVCLAKPFANLNRKYELVLSQFHAQREANPAVYCRMLRELATGRVLILAPYAESPNRKAAGHLSVIDDDLLADVGAENVAIFRSPAWGTEEGHRVVRFELPGLAEAAS